MRIEKLDLIAFGPFTGVVLDFSAGHEGLHLVYGPNEAGKTSALRALRQALYGIPKNSSDNFIHENSRMRIGAVLRKRDGAMLTFTRRKGNRQTVLDPAAAPIEDQALLDFLGGVDASAFETMFGLKHDNLVEGGRQIARGGGDVGESLFAAASGIANLREIRSGLDDDKNGLFKPQAHTAEINVLLRKLKDVEQSIRDTQLSADAWETAEKALADLLEQRKSIERALRETRGRQNLNQRIIEALPLVVRRRELVLELSELESVVELAKGFSAERVRLMSELANCSNGIEQRQDAIKARTREIAELRGSKDLNILEHRHSIDQLQRELGVYNKGQNDRTTILEPELADIQRQADFILHELNCQPESLDRIFLDDSERARLQELARLGGVLAERREKSAESVAVLQNQIDECRDHLAEIRIPGNQDPARLGRIVNSIQRRGNLEQELEGVKRDLARLNENIARKTAALHPAHYPADRPAGAAVPMAETIEQFRIRYDRLESSFDSLNRNIANATREIGDLEAELKKQQMAGQVPTEQELQNERERRNQGWKLVRSCWQSGSADQQAMDMFIAHYDARGDLATAYEGSVRVADDVADRLRHEAQRVSDYINSTSHLDASRKKLDAQQAEKSELEQKSRELSESWEALWQPTGIPPLTPSEMVTWRKKWEEIVNLADQASDLKIKEETLLAQIAAASKELKAELESLLGAPIEQESLEILLDRSHEEIKRIGDMLTRRNKLQDTLRDMEAKELPKATEAAEDANCKWLDWQGEWRKMMARLEMAADTTPAAANERLAKLGELREQLGKAESYRGRLEGIADEAEQFKARVIGMTEPIAPGLANLPVAQIVTELADQLTECGRVATLIDEKEREIGRLRKQIEERQAAWGGLNATIETMAREARCARPEELPRAEEDSRAKTGLREQLNHVDDKLRILSGGLDLAEFVVQVSSSNLDDVTAGQPQIESDIVGMEQRINELGEEIGRVSQSMQTMQENDSASELEQTRQEVLAQIADKACNYARLHIAAELLRKGLDWYREQHKAPILELASDIFSRLSCGAFKGLTVDYGDQDEPVLMGVRPDDRRVEVDEMSDGTCDQLYLALRLAYLENRAQHNEPMPLIMDDTLINFDNPRAESTLAELGRLSASMQIIMFTHHHHILELAQKVLPDDISFIHSIGSN